MIHPNVPKLSIKIISHLLGFKTNISFVYHNLYGIVCFHLALEAQVLGYCYDDDDLFLNMIHEVSVCWLCNASSFLLVTIWSPLLACFSIVISKLDTFS